MNRVLIFAGGTGRRMNSVSKPKQFLTLHDKPVIIYTIEAFERHREIDDIIVVCLSGWISELEKQLKKAMVEKVSLIVPGGKTGHDSIYLGLKAINERAERRAEDISDDIILIHDGVRPLITEALISENIKAVQEYGSAISSSPALESIVEKGPGMDIVNVPPRQDMYVAKAPQSFRFGHIWELYTRVQDEIFRSIDSADLCSHFGERPHIVPCSRYNLKITQPADYYVFRALFEAMENEQIPEV